jgi:hypothetical protein
MAAFGTVTAARYFVFQKHGPIFGTPRLKVIAKETEKTLKTCLN